MKFSCEKYLLQTACAIASRAAASKSPIPALEGLLLQAGDDLRVTGYDLKEGIYTNIQADVVQGGSIVVGSRFFGEMIRRMPDGIVTLSTDQNDSVKVKCGKSEFNFMGISPEDYPEMPVLDPINTISLPQKILRSMINQTIFAVADTDVRPIYTGTLFEVEGDTLTLVSVDGYRLAKRCEKLESAKMENCSFVVPGSALSDIERICDDVDDPVEISVGAKHISFLIGETVVISRRLEGEFLNYRRSIPEMFRTTVTLRSESEVRGTLRFLPQLVMRPSSNARTTGQGTGTAWSREPRSPPSVGTTWRSQKGLAFGLKALTAPPLC